MMPSLTVILIIVGAVLIGAVVLYNYIQEERYRRQAKRQFERHDGDFILGETHSDDGSEQRSSRVQIANDSTLGAEARRVIEVVEAELPSLGSEPALGNFMDDVGTPAASEMPPVQAVKPEPPVERMILDWGDEKPATGMPPQPAVRPAVSQATLDMPPPLDGEYECVARLRLVAATPAGLAGLLSSLRRLGKPLRAYGQRTEGAWEALQGDARGPYLQIAFGLQLADRSGPVNLDQLNVFCRVLYEFAAEDGGAVTCPDKAEVLRRAADLDAFCSEVDVLMGLNLVSSDARPFTSEALQAIVLEAGMELDAEGSYVARDARGQLRYTLSNQESAPFPADGRGVTTHGVVLQFDVPRVAEGLVAFDQMGRLALDLVARMQGRLVDAKGRVIGEDHLSRDRAHLAGIYARMDARGIPAGSEQALRLFS